MALGLSHVEPASESHEETLAPGLKPLGNCIEDSGANQHEPSRGSVPAPVDVELTSPLHSHPCATERITKEEKARDKKLATAAVQPQPIVNTKAVETSDYTAPKRQENGTSSNAEEAQRNSQSQHAARKGSISGSFNEDALDPRQYRNRYDDSDHEGESSEAPPDINRKEIEIAPDVLQPTNEGSGSLREGYHMARVHENKDLNIEEGAIGNDEDDPEAIYRIRSEETVLFDGMKRSTTFNSTKEERRAEKREQKARKRQKLVKDPITGKDIWIENVRGSTEKILQNEGIVAPNQSVLQQSDVKAAQILQQLHKVPFKDDKTNLLFFPMNPPEWSELLDDSQRTLFNWGYLMIAASLTVQVLLYAFPLRYSLWLNVLLSVGSILFIKNKVEKTFITAFQTAEKVRGHHATVNALPESVEWLNNIIRTVWPTINREIFAAPADLLEDVLQKQVPVLISSVKVSDLDIGTVPLRLLSMRYLPDDGSPRGDEDDAGEYVNLECSFGYRAGKTDKSLHSRANNIHLLIWFMVGLKKVIGIPIPIWVEVHGIIGKARVRIQLLPDPPFLKHGTISLLGMPKVELSTTPISSSLFNVMNLPFVSQIVKFAVKTVLKDLIAPRSYTLDISKLIVGDDVKKETASFGILMICLHGATNVPKADHRPGASKVDPYVTVQYSRFGKTMYSTRVINQDYNPVWEESCFLPVLPSVIKAGEKIRINLWDSDRFTSDDLLGRVELDLTPMVINPGKFERRIDDIVGTAAKLHWSIGFFGKLPIPDQPIPELVDLRVPPELRHSPDFKPEKPIISVDSKAEQLICRVPPNPEYPGILSIQIHQISDLGIIQSKKKLYEVNRALQDEAVELGQGDETGSSPSTYCNVSLNDELVYKSRTRAFTNRPIFNSSFERFVRSFDDTHIRITVRDQRFREEDPIIGIVPLSLKEELSAQGQVTRWYPLSEGIGYGHIRLSILFRSIDCRLPKTLQGWNIGTLSIFSARAVVEAADAEILQDCRLRIDTMLGHKSIGAVHAQMQEDGSVDWDFADTIVMPIRRRHATSLNMECHRGGIPFTKNGLFSGIYGASIIALSALEDNERAKIKLPLFQTNDYVRFKQNTLSQEGDSSDCSLKRLGYMEIDCILEAGLSDAHRKFSKRSTDLAQAHEAWEAEVSYRKRLAFDALRQQKVTDMKAQKLHRMTDDAEISHSPAQRGRRKSEIHFLSEASDHDSEDDDEQSTSLGSTARDGFAAALRDGEHEDWNDDRSSLHSQKSAHKTLADWYQDKRKEQREGYRRHRGIMAKKPARTALWLKNSLRKSMNKTSNMLSLKKDDEVVENEM